VRVNGLLGASEHGSIDSSGEGDSQRIMSGDGNHLGLRTDELIQILRIANDDVLLTELQLHYFLEDS